MPRKILFTALLCIPFMLKAQLNMSLASQIQYDNSLNDIWGYVAPDDTEYALVGLRNGVSIVSLADPGNAVEVAFVPGQNSTWRDIKTWGTFAYVVTDQGGTTEGVTVIDLSNLPNAVNFFHWTPDIPELGLLNNCHNIYIDEAGYAYLAGCNINNGGILYIDLFSTPGQPAYVDKGFNRYAHDVFTQGNKMYTSEIFFGRMGIYDVSNKSITMELGLQETPFEFTHNIWATDDNTIAFTTDEQGNAPVTAYDVSDPSDIQELDQYRPVATLGSSVIPHNVHVWQDWLIISYYTDGGKIVDASRPHNLIEVGNFDTFFGAGAGFNGVWGAYPFLPSGLVLLADIGNGLYVLNANYVNACFVEGLVTNADTGSAIDEVEVTIDIAEEPNLNFSGLDGTYATGIATAGTYEITFSKPGFVPFSTNVNFENGVLVVLDVQLEPLALFNFSGIVIDASNANEIPNAIIKIDNGQSVFTVEADENGQFLIADVYESNYQLLAGAWGYQQQHFDFMLNSDDAITLALIPSYEDDFALDLGWKSSEGPLARSGGWEIGEPQGTVFNGSMSNPDFDVEGDLGDQCYVTGNAGNSAPFDDVDGGRVTLTSPSMNLLDWETADSTLSFIYSLWFYNAGGSVSPNDSLVVSISNGVEEVVVEVVTESNSFWRPASEINIEQFIELTNDMKISFSTSDFDDAGGHIVEAAVDAFSVGGLFIVNTDTPAALADWILSPNPYQHQFQLNYQLEEGAKQAVVNVYDVLGQRIETQSIHSSEATLTLGQDWPKGVYFIQMEIDGQTTATRRVVKQ